MVMIYLKIFCVILLRVKYFKLVEVGKYQLVLIGGYQKLFGDIGIIKMKRLDSFYIFMIIREMEELSGVWEVYGQRKMIQNIWRKFELKKGF